MHDYRHRPHEVGEKVEWADLKSATTLGYVERSQGRAVFTITWVSADGDFVRVDHPDPNLAQHSWQESWFRPATASAP